MGLGSNTKKEVKGGRKSFGGRKWRKLARSLGDAIMEDGSNIMLMGEGG